MKPKFNLGDKIRIEVDGKIRWYDAINFVMADPYPVNNVIISKILSFIFKKTHPKIVKVYCPDGEALNYEIFEELR